MKTIYAPSPCVSFGTIALAISALGLALVVASCNFFGDPDQFRPKAPETVVAPITASPAGGVVANGTQVTLTTTTEGAAIYYTINETEPSLANGTLYSADEKPVITPDNFILRAIAVKDGLENSAPIEITYTIAGHASRPTASPASGYFIDGTEITLDCATLGAAIYYTLDETEPTIKSTPYDPNEKPSIKYPQTVLRAIAVHDSMSASGILTVNYRVPVAMPTVTFETMPGSVPIPEGIVPYGTELELSCATESATILYTLDGTTPTVHSETYDDAAKPILTAGQTLKAIAKTDADTSAVLTATPIATSIEQFEAWLGEVNGTKKNPALIPVVISLGTMTDIASNWRLLLAALSIKLDYVMLDLSLCAIDKDINDEYTFGHNNHTMVSGMNQIIGITLPKSVTSIGVAAFRGCINLVHTSLPDGLTSIDTSAFYDCTNLVLTSLPHSLTYIDDAAFYGCANLALTSLPNNLTSIGRGAFRDCTKIVLTSLPDRLTIIRDSAFEGCIKFAFTSLPDSLRHIGYNVFEGYTNLALTSLPDGLTYLSTYAFRDCTSLALTSLPDGLTQLGQYAFRDCTSLALTSLPDGTTSIVEGVFYGCTNLTLISLPDSLTSITKYAFVGCTSLSEVTIHAITPPALGTYVFNDTHPDLKIWVPASSVNAYKTADGWKDYADKIFAIQ